MSNGNVIQLINEDEARARLLPQLRSMTVEQRAEFIDRLHTATHLPQRARELATDLAMEVTITEALRDALR